MHVPVSVLHFNTHNFFNILILFMQVDKHIRRLDADLARFEADLKDKTLNPNLAEVDAAHKSKFYVKYFNLSV